MNKICASVTLDPNEGIFECSKFITYQLTPTVYILKKHQTVLRLKQI